MSNPNLFPESTGTGDKVANYFGQLAAANHVKKLVERYLTLAPVFIGGPANTSLENPHIPPLHPPPPPLAANPVSFHEIQDKGMTNGLQNAAGLQKLHHQPVNVSQQQQDLDLKSSTTNTSSSNSTNMFNPAIYNPAMAAVAEQQSRFYNQFYRTMAIAAVQQQQHQLQQQLPKPPQHQQSQQQQQIQQQQQQQQHQRPKRRRTSAGNDPSGPPSHLSGEMIRRLREKQKMKNAAAVASAVASVAAVTTSGGRQFDKPQPPALLPSANSKSNSIKSSTEAEQPLAATNSSSMKTTGGMISSSGGPTLGSSGASVAPSSASSAISGGGSSASTTSGASTSTSLKPPPLMSSRDMTSASLEETVISSQVIPCFNIGGEMRLCFPQILKQILGSFHSEQICLACEELLIHVAPASTQQLVVLKGAGVLPLAAHQCGLITKSDAERLAAYLMTNKMSTAQANAANNANNVENNNSNNDLISDEINNGGGPGQRMVLHVQHECFGKATGTLYPALYRDPKAKCIKCTICGLIMDPQSFVRHLHSERENQTCHWGFDASNWRSYVHISDIYYKKPDNAAVASDSIGCDAIDRAVSPKSTEEKSSSSSVLAPEKAQNMLDDVKKRFSLPIRKQSSSEISETGGSIAKRPRLDESAAESHQNSKKHAGQPGGQLQLHQQQAGAMVAGGGLGPALQVGGNFRPWSEDVSAAAAAAAAATAAAAETARRGHYYQNINRQPFFGEDPSHYVDEVKQSLATERGLNPRNRELVMEVLGRLAERVQSAEHSRNAVVNELVSLRERFQNLEAELSKKCDELRQLFLLQQSQQQHASEDTNSTATPSPPTSTTSVLRALRKPSGHCDGGNFNEEEDSSDDSSTYSSGTGRAQPPTLMFSKELESLRENLQDQDSESLRERMLTIENQLKQLQQSITTTSSISSSTAEQQEVILVREAEPSSQTLCNSNSANHASSIDSENSSKTDQENLNNSKD